MSAFGIPTVPINTSGTQPGGKAPQQRKPQRQRPNNKGVQQRNGDKPPGDGGNNRQRNVSNGRKTSKNTPPPAQEVPIDDPEYVVQHKVKSAKVTLPIPSKIHDQFVGGVLKNPESLGYSKMGPKVQELPNYLIHEPKFLERHEFHPDAWDIANQEKMAQLGESAQDQNELMDTLEQMRKVERSKMEAKGLVDKANVSKSLAEAIVFRGSCLYMCPVFERLKRVVNGDISKFEKLGSNTAIKAFSRSEAGQAPQLPSDVRPPHVLVQTLDYMIDNLIDKLPEAESFVWNRTRSIRQDFTYQNYFGPEAIYCIEKICRIHILTLHIMAGSEVEYSQQQEIEQLNKSLETLSEIYDDLHKIGKKSPNEAEFRAYYILSYYNKPELDQTIHNLPSDIFHSPIIQMALMFRGFMLQNNTTDRDNLPGGFNFFTHFFRNCLDANTPILISFLLETHFNEIRFYALKSMSVSYHSGGKPYYASQLLEMLAFDTVDELVNFVEYYDLNVSTDNDQLCVHLSPFKYSFLKEKEKLKQAHSKKLDAKLAGVSYKQIIDSGITLEASKHVTFTQSKAPTVQFQAPPMKTSKPTQPPPPQTLTTQPISQDSAAKKPTVQITPPVQAPSFQITATAKPVLEKTVQPPKPVKPKITELPNYRNAALQVYNEMLFKTVDDSIKSLLPSIVNDLQKTKQRTMMVDSLSLELYQAFMHEAVHFAVLDIKAMRFREAKLRQKLIQFVKPVAAKCLQNVKDRRNKIEEFNQFKNKIINEKKRISSDNSMVKEQLLKRRAVSIREPAKETVDYRDLWEPLDLSVAFQNAKGSCRLLIVVKDWNSISSRWLLHKLGMRPSKRLSTFVNKYSNNKDLKMRITGLPDQFSEQEFFSKTTCILLELGLIQEAPQQDINKKLLVDYKVLKKISEYVEANCLYDRCQFVVLFYDASKSGIDINKVENLLNLEEFRSQRHVASIEVCDMRDGDLSSKLQTALQTFKGTLEKAPVVQAAETTTTSVKNEEMENLRKNRRIQFLRSTMRPNTSKIRLKSSMSFNNTTMNNTTFDRTSFLAPQPDMTFTKFNNNFFQSQEMSNYLTSTPAGKMAGTSRVGSFSAASSSKPSTNNKDTQINKISELRRLTASILQQKRQS